MIYLNLLLGFLQVGCFAFGGAYGAISLIRQIVMGYGWMTEEEISYMIAVSESTPGPIMINLATYVGYNQAGIPGCILASLAVVFPSFVIILVIAALLKNYNNNPYVKAVMGGLKPCMVGVIIATGASMLVAPCFSGTHVDLMSVLLMFGLWLLMYFYRRSYHKKISPIVIIVISAVMGVIIY